MFSPPILAQQIPENWIDREASDVEISASVKIQATFRAYWQRKLWKTVTQGTGPSNDRFLDFHFSRRLAGARESERVACEFTRSHQSERGTRCHDALSYHVQNGSPAAQQIPFQRRRMVARRIRRSRATIQRATGQIVVHHVQVKKRNKINT